MDAIKVEKITNPSTLIWFRVAVIAQFPTLKLRIIQIWLKSEILSSGQTSF